MDTSLWKRIRIKLSEIRLDPKNVRLDIPDIKVEADIAEDLFANEHALNLVEGICSIGFLTHDTPIVLKRAGTYVVVEGNRRIAALKAISNPMLVPDFSNRIRSILSKYPDFSLIDVVEVLVAPSQDEADRIIAAIHTGNLRRKWSPARQAAFFQAQIDAGKSYTELMERYPTSDVKKFVSRAKFINMIRRTSFSSPGNSDFVQGKKFRTCFSTIWRIYESKEFKEVTGIQLSNNGELEMKVSPDQFAGIAEVIVTGLSAGHLNTRTLNKVIDNPRFDRLMHEMRIFIQPSVKTTSPSCDSKDEKVSTEQAAKPTKKARPQRKLGYLSTASLSFGEEFGIGFRQTLQELSVTSVQNKPMAVFLLMRAVLEKGIKSFAEQKGVDIKSHSNNGTGYVFLKHCIDWLTQYASNEKRRDIVQVLRNMDKIVFYTISKQKLDAVNHNHHFAVNPDEAIEMWAKIEPILKYIQKV